MRKIKVGLFTALVVLMGLNSGAHAASAVVCTIEGPCIWALPQSGEPPVLDVCLTQLEGDLQTLELSLEDVDGRAVGTAELKVKKLTKELFQAESADGKFSLSANYNGEGYLGGIVVSPEKVGFFTFCETN